MAAAGLSARRSVATLPSAVSAPSSLGAARRMDGLSDEPRSGAVRKIGDDMDVVCSGRRGRYAWRDALGHRVAAIVGILLDQHTARVCNSVASGWMRAIDPPQHRH